MTSGPMPTLARARDLLGPSLRKMVDRPDPMTRLVVTYHLGWCDRHGVPTEALARYVVDREA